MLQLAIRDITTWRSRRINLLNFLSANVCIVFYRFSIFCVTLSFEIFRCIRFSNVLCVICKKKLDIRIRYNNSNLFLTNLILIFLCRFCFVQWDDVLIFPVLAVFLKRMIFPAPVQKHCRYSVGISRFAIFAQIIHIGCFKIVRCRVKSKINNS